MNYEHAVKAKAMHFEGDPCKHGHTLRYTSTKDCVQCAKESGKRHRKRYPRPMTDRLRKANETADYMRRIAPAKPSNPVPKAGWPFAERFDDDPRAAKWEPRWRESWAA